jgi:hypothetical protein
MGWKRRVFRIAWIMTVTVVAFVLLVVATIQGEQYLQRRRAENLLGQLQTVDLRATTFSEVERVFGRRASRSAKCDSASCDYVIQLKSPIGGEALSLVVQRLHIPSELVFHALPRLGWRPAEVDAKIAVRNGVVLCKSLKVVVLGQQDRWLIGRVESVPRLPRPRDSESFHAELVHFPDYVIGQPGGCTGCVEGYVLFTPHTAGEDVRRLMDFNLACLTRWLPCGTQADILPSAWAQYEDAWRKPDPSLAPTPGLPTAWRENEREWRLRNPALDRISDPRLVKVLGRDATAVAVLEIIQIERRNEFCEYVLRDGHFQATGKTCVELRPRARVLQVLKGGSWHEGQSITLQAPEDELRFHNDERLIVLLDPFWAADICDVLRWQVLPPTPENLALVRIGIAEDYQP